MMIKHTRPAFDTAAAARIAAEHYGLDAPTAALLPGEHDANLLITDQAGTRYVLKIAHASEDRALLEFQHAALQHCAGLPAVPLPTPHRALDGTEIITVTAADGKRHLARLLHYLPGRLLADVTPHPPALLESLGTALGQLAVRLADFAHPAANRALKWDLSKPLWALTYLHQIADAELRTWCSTTLERFAQETAPQLVTLRQQVIMNDANDYNVLVSGSGFAARVSGLIDVGDLLRAPLICELAIACTYVMLGKPDPLAAAAVVVRGFHAQLPLTEAELAVLDPLIRTRLAVSLTNSSYEAAAEPDNPYLQVSATPARALVQLLSTTPPTFATACYRAACGLPASPTEQAVRTWLTSHAAQLRPVVDGDPDHALVFDLSVGSLELGNWPAFQDEPRLSADLFGRLETAGATIGIGRYQEPRAIYTSDLFRAASNDGPEWRTLHIGLDLFQPAGAPVYAPLSGTVHSFADNAGPRDYGPTIILEHRPADGPVFYTLYGHLSRESLVDKHVGMPFAAGAQIATLGDAAVNGGWPPHLHLQLITDLLGRAGEFPGVARPSEAAVWTSLCPDPNLLVGVPAARFPAPEPEEAEILALRRRHLSPNLSISYQRPLTIVRGFMQQLYAADGRAYLDAVNNVPHVGHNHPHVVSAAQRQLAVLNTNTRYLHPLLTRYARRLAATLPPELSVIFLVNSGSEANELALRLARTATGQRDMVVLDVGYHGNTNAVVEVSSYKFDGPGGNGAAPHIHKVAMPDVYRGAFTGADAGPRFAEEIEQTLTRVRTAGRGIAGMIAESMLSCGGQIVLPPGYLRAAYSAVRAAGGVCIADEVQTGFGRVGTHFWAFETQGVVPDIVTMGKPIGNGHPLGAVATTPAIAARFANGMEYFNTYGGNPVSCAVGLAVLDVIAAEGLQSHALLVGERLIGGLRELVTAHAVVGDARGLGMFVGIELVTDRQTKAPAAAQAQYIVNRVREHGVLLSTDGPLHNVIKIKPPLAFTLSDADRLIATLDLVLREDAARG
jgi:4-aminobutyrate aminotransferase-like enzyme/Ser/Thr protein kinase RdoA (MazF antagonist)